MLLLAVGVIGASLVAALFVGGYVGRTFALMNGRFSA